MKGKLPDDEMADAAGGLEVFHVEQLEVPGLEAERCLVWMRRDDARQPIADSAQSSGACNAFSHHGIHGSNLLHRQPEGRRRQDDDHRQPRRRPRPDRPARARGRPRSAGQRDDGLGHRQACARAERLRRAARERIDRRSAPTEPERRLRRARREPRAGRRGDRARRARAPRSSPAGRARRRSPTTTTSS